MKKNCEYEHIEGWASGNHRHSNFNLHGKMRVLIVEVGLNYEFIFNTRAIITSFRKLGITAHLGSAIFL